MTNPKLSPAAQEVLTVLCMDELNGPQQLMARAHAAAALRAAGDQLTDAPSAHTLYAIADELENLNG